MSEPLSTGRFYCPSCSDGTHDCPDFFAARIGDGYATVACACDPCTDKHNAAYWAKFQATT